MSLAVDPVCASLVDEDAAAAKGHCSTHGQHRYCFCSGNCRRLFERNRDAYIITRDVVCGREVDPDIADLRSLLRTHAGRRFRFCSRDCLEQFMEDPTRYAHPAHLPPAAPPSPVAEP